MVERSTVGGMKKRNRVACRMSSSQEVVVLAGTFALAVEIDRLRQKKAQLRRRARGKRGGLFEIGMLLG